MSTFFVKSLLHQRKDRRRRLNRNRRHTLVEHRNSPPCKHSATRQPSAPRLKPWETVSPTGGALSLEGKGLPGTACYTGREECGDCPTAACTQRYDGPTCARAPLRRAPANTPILSVDGCHPNRGEAYLSVTVIYITFLSGLVLLAPCPPVVGM